MEIKIIKRNDIESLNLEFDTFDYYSKNPKPFNELLRTDEKILNLIKKISKGKIYALTSMEFMKESSSNCGLWGYHSLPNENPTKDFKYKVDFTKTLCEHKFIGKKYITYVGIAEITIEFYLQNYLFFNRNNGTAIFVCEEKNINNIILNITNNFEKKLEETNVLDIDYLAQIAECNSIVIITKDNEEFKELKIIFKNEVNLIGKIKEILNTK